ncbi:MAG: hypothetical protein HRF45_03625 [Fimbriimonadia bacterium]|jgi:hypothetical protein
MNEPSVVVSPVTLREMAYTVILPAYGFFLPGTFTVLRFLTRSPTAAGPGELVARAGGCRV